jgi:hypothetical protein
MKRFSADVGATEAIGEWGESWTAVTPGHPFDVGQMGFDAF